MEHGLMHRAEAFMAIHDPQNRDGFNKALRTLRYEEALICQTALVQSRDSSRKATATACADTRLKDDFVESLPFSLTDGQQQVIADISDDMARDYPMQRLLQGEVGSGKTVVAVAAMMQAVGSGKQAVLVAPTQVLAEQHYSSIRGWWIGCVVPAKRLTKTRNQGNRRQNQRTMRLWMKVDKSRRETRRNRKTVDNRMAARWRNCWTANRTACRTFPYCCSPAA